jgi:hypothetical protein
MWWNASVTRDGRADASPAAMQRYGAPLTVNRWPVYSVEATREELTRIGAVRTIGTIVPGYVAVAFMLSICFENLWVLGAAAILGSLLLVGLRRTRVVKARIRAQATAALRARCEERRGELVVQLSADDRQRLERLESLVEYLRRLAIEQRQPLDATLVERLDVLLHHYVRMAIDRQRVLTAYRIVADSAAAGSLPEGSSADKRISSQLRSIRRMRQHARDTCEQQLRSAGALLETISELVTLAYEQRLCRQIVVRDLIERIDHVVEEFVCFGDARAEAEAATASLECSSI